VISNWYFIFKYIPPSAVSTFSGKNAKDARIRGVGVVGHHIYGEHRGIVVYARREQKFRAAEIYEKLYHRARPPKFCDIQCFFLQADRRKEVSRVPRMSCCHLPQRSGAARRAVQLADRRRAPLSSASRRRNRSEYVDGQSPGHDPHCERHASAAARDARSH